MQVDENGLGATLKTQEAHLVADSNEKVGENEEVKQSVTGLLTFNVKKFKEFISTFRNNIEIDEITGNVILSKFVLDNIKSYIGIDWDVYTKYSEFKQILIEELKLDGEFAGYYDEAIKSYIFVNKTEEKRFGGIPGLNIENIIVRDMKLIEAEQRLDFLKDSVSGIHLSLDDVDKYIGRGYRKFVLNQIHMKIKEKFSKHMDDKTAEGVAGKLLRDNFEYINSILGSDLLREISTIIVSKLLKEVDLLEDEIISMIKVSVEFMEERFSNNISGVGENNCNYNFKNDVLIQFGEKIKLWFKGLYGVEIDDELVKGLISQLITADRLKLGLSEFSKSIFVFFPEKTTELVNIFLLYNGGIIEEKGRKFRYPRFHFRDLAVSNDDYSVEKVFKQISDFIESSNKNLVRINDEEHNIALYKMKHSSNTKIISEGNIKLSELQTQMSSNTSKISDLDIEIVKLEKTRPKGFFASFYIKNFEKSLITLVNEKEIIETENLRLENLIKQIKHSVMVAEYNNKNVDSEDKLYLYKEKAEKNELIYQRIVEDFTRTLLLGRELVK